jgi:hypothetical protein
MVKNNSPVDARMSQKNTRPRHLMTPVDNLFPDIIPSLSGCNHPLKMSFEDYLAIALNISIWKNTIQDFASCRF